MDAFQLRVLLSFVLGGLAVALFTTAAERMGSRVGGLLLSFPVKVTIAMILIGLNEGVGVASQAATAIPLGLGINLVFLGATAFFIQRLGAKPALAAATGVWLVIGLAGVLLIPAGVAWSLAAFLLAYASIITLLRNVPHAKPRPRPRDRFGLVGLLTRALGAGTIVAASLILARYAGPTLGGLASVFPSGWITTMIILTHHHGADFTRATTRVMVLASVAPMLFGLVVWLAYPSWGVWWGTAAAMGAALLASSVIAWVLGRSDEDREHANTRA